MLHYRQLPCPKDSNTKLRIEQVWIVFQLEVEGKYLKQHLSGGGA